MFAGTVDSLRGVERWVGWVVECGEAGDGRDDVSGEAGSMWTWLVDGTAWCVEKVDDVTGATI
jgi:hypothetical protein